MIVIIKIKIIMFQMVVLTMIHQ